VPSSSAADLISSKLTAKTPYTAPLDDMRADSGYQTGVSITEDGKSTATGTPIGEQEFFDAEEVPDGKGVETDTQRKKFPYRMDRPRGGKTKNDLVTFDEEDEGEEEEE